MAADINPEDLQGGAHPGGSPDDRYERSDARSSAVLMACLVLFTAAVMTAGAVYFYYKYALKLQAQADRPTLPMSTSVQPTHFQGSQNLQLSPKLDMDIYREAQEERLNNYGWVSKEAQVVHIPIYRAIALVAERGLPTRSAAASAEFADQASSAPQESSGGRTYRNRLR